MDNISGMEQKKEINSQARVEIIEFGPIKITGNFVLKDLKRDKEESVKEVFCADAEIQQISHFAMNHIRNNTCTGLSGYNMKAILHSFIGSKTSFFFSQLPDYFSKSILQIFLVAVCQYPFAHNKSFIGYVESISIKVRTVFRRIGIIPSEAFHTFSFSCH